MEQLITYKIVLCPRCNCSVKINLNEPFTNNFILKIRKYCKRCQINYTFDENSLRGILMILIRK